MTELHLALADARRLQKAYDGLGDSYKNEQWFSEMVGDSIYIAIAGSNDMIDWIQNLTAWRIWLSQKKIGNTEYKGTAGYVEAANNLYIVFRHLRKDRKIVLSGHSKGGPVAAFLALMLMEQGYDVELRTFAAPKCVTKPIPELGLVKQYIIAGDYVPDYPKSFRSWQHFGIPYVMGDERIDRIGVIRDIRAAVKAHLIPAYIQELEKLCTVA